jgi:hypothetical protein
MRGGITCRDSRRKFEALLGRYGPRERPSTAACANMARSRAPLLRPIHLAAVAEKAHRSADKFDRLGKICSGPFMTEYRAGRLDDFKDGGRLLLKCDSAEIGIS